MLLLGAAHVEAQVGVPASPFVSPDHWSYRVLRRLDHAGRLPAGADVARQSIPEAEIAALLQAGGADSYYDRFVAEFDGPAELRGGLVREHGRVAPGIGYDTANWTGARPLDIAADAIAAVRLDGSYGGWLGAAVTVGVQGIDEAQLVGARKWVGAWIGRRTLGYGVANGGGLIVDQHRFDGAGAYLPRPVRLPLLGALRFETQLARVDNVLNLGGVQREIEPWFWSARGSIEPFAGVRIGLNRAMMFGGEGNLPVTFERVVKNLIGIYAENDESSFANQVLSFDFRVRMPGVPLAAYLEWGTDDAAGGWWDVPAVLAGLEVVHFGSGFDAALGVEHLRFSETCCSNSIWYRNAWFRGSWADGDDALGHGLGGHGSEWRVFAHGGAGPGVLGNIALFTRDRGAENLFAPEREGESSGGAVGVNVLVGERLQLLLQGELERGDEWDRSRGLFSVRYSF